MRGEHTVLSKEVFVFGSNLGGLHGGGAARYARRLLGAEMGCGEGPTGRCYALPTCSEPGVPLGLVDVADAVERFKAFAKDHSDLSFYVSRVGCGLAGFADAQIGPLFRDAPRNCSLPDGWGV